MLLFNFEWKVDTVWLITVFYKRYIILMSRSLHLFPILKKELIETTKSTSTDNNSRVYEWFSCCFPAADCTGVAELRLHQTRPQDDLSPGRGGPPQRVEEIPAPVRRQRRRRRRPQVTSCLFDLLICRFIECWFVSWLVICLFIDLLVNWLVC